MCETGVTEQTLQMAIDLPSLQLLRRFRLGGTEGTVVSGSRLRFTLAAYDIFSGVLAANTHTHISVYICQHSLIIAMIECVEG